MNTEINLIPINADRNDYLITINDPENTEYNTVAVDISTAHITANDGKLLREQNFKRIYPAAPEGWSHLFRPTKSEKELEKIRQHGFSEYFINIVKLAETQEYPYIRFYADAEIIKDLPQFTW